jgi:RNA polymerase sigma-70 factor (ECF subfamily)
MPAPSEFKPAMPAKDEARMGQPTFEEMSTEMRTALLEAVPHLRAFARSLTRNRDQADDLVNDTIVRAIAASNLFTPGTNFRAWVFTILRNLFYNQGRRGKSRFSSIDDLTVDEPSESATQEASLEFCDFRRAFWQLPDHHREALILVGASGLNYEDAARICGCQIGTMKSRVSRARAELRRMIDDDAIVTKRGDSKPITGKDPFDLIQNRSGAQRVKG